MDLLMSLEAGAYEIRASSAHETCCILILASVGLVSSQHNTISSNFQKGRRRDEQLLKQLYDGGGDGDGFYQLGVA